MLCVRVASRREGYTWRGLPGDFPPWQTVYGYFWRWSKDGTWLKIHDKLYQWVRVAAGREPSPSQAVVDSQSVETARGKSSEDTVGEFIKAVQKAVG
ncbi:transposase [Nostoc sp.]|uniref:transposase n=1 Tax=Nostoc sp. TaxID=1180 RepID=UPI002FF59805